MTSKRSRQCLGRVGLARAFRKELKRNVFKALVATQRDEVRTFQKLFPKAAKKRRVRKKWLKRFGKPFSQLFEEALMRPKSEWWQTKVGMHVKSWQGGTIELPFSYAPQLSWDPPS